jgi:hypothetical protein
LETTNKIYSLNNNGAMTEITIANTIINDWEDITKDKEGIYILVILEQ